MEEDTLTEDEVDEELGLRLEDQRPRAYAGNDTAEKVYDVNDTLDRDTGKPSRIRKDHDQADDSLMNAAKEARNTMVIHVEFGDSIPTGPGVKRYCRLHLPRTALVERAKRDLCRLWGYGVYPSFMRLSLPNNGEVLQDTEQLHKYDIRDGAFVRLDIVPGDIFEALRKDLQDRGVPLAHQIRRQPSAANAGAAAATGPAAAAAAAAGGPVAAAAVPAAPAAAAAPAPAAPAAAAAAAPAVPAAAAAPVPAQVPVALAAAAAAPAPAAPAAAAAAAATSPARRQRQAAAAPPQPRGGAEAAQRPPRQPGVNDELRSPTAGAPRATGRTNKHWSNVASTALLRGMLKYGTSWKCIAEDPAFAGALEGRTHVNLKDRWVTLRKAAHRKFEATRGGLSTEVIELTKKVLEIPGTQ